MCTNNEKPNYASYIHDCKECINCCYNLCSRHILAVLHFNSNLLRDIKQKPDGTDQVLVVYPKFKNGEATVRDVRVKPIVGKVPTCDINVSNKYIN